MSKVLVVDDSRVTQHMLKLLLRRNDFDVVLAGDGAAGLNALYAEAVDLVISDINMPCLDGFGMVAALREDARFAALPILMLTATGDEDNKERADSLGVNGFITQPFDSQQLIATVKSLITA
jgi:DNA-binding response OmpR family regulator